MTQPEFTKNETVALMHKDTVFCLRSIADHIEKWEMGREEIVEFLRDVADQKEAQIVVVELRDEINKQP